MARSKSEIKKRNKAKKNAAKLSPDQAPALLAAATNLLQTGQPAEALLPAHQALTCLSSTPLAESVRLPALELIGEINVELGEVDSARSIFLQAAALDPDATLLEDAGGGPNKFLWLAQLSEQGGHDSIKWFEKGCTSLRTSITDAEGSARTPDDHTRVKILKQKLANALCGAAEVYMTDLSWEADAEQRCEALVTEACMAAPEAAEPLQTLASVRISQVKLDEARSALTRSLELWNDLPPDHPDIPDYPTRISLARLLMEAELEDKAMDVLDRLVFEDDSSVEAWYLGGWCLNLLAKKQAGETQDESHDAEQLKTLKRARRWLRTSLKLYTQQDYEDDRLRDHASELVTELNAQIGNDDVDNDEEEEWVDVDEDEDDGDGGGGDDDEEMQGA